ncbi:amino acid ABC transporter permease [Alkalihalobacillus alcalophilus ATCC 27647 = CGMCC 1.3604]|uniref:Amino acid ABC transporter permease n=1 Tax=Alkalihalobacillus alcalophilus ATCC 27647 = CGMCC 1.3604 TaxID=1218173 RepID=J8TQM1_ALKAL|nr:ectoine/hydroxyectoine ABC transporter permease subunit EhuC [Alkalihalobacillus alcalophilus]AFV25805.1 amino acid transporter [Alkalihalobacillus alcalophilus ATCC 27647 = CGMCC 1.3604]KGA95755.1 amino acid ABC transporter permease [Alkalihalobacillus alcalophilus ATCC 27647 = CGMCC 1.3604]MED1563646.1 ectoine/hydroxyectoine ABC transporter permease subunit EhuC [Alkalihalobacillus alcalophilus]THG90564.1 amino acid ABC transporter permease [Alkalihalobacillus alcalophilus ATCC 27647 = CGM
MFSNASYFIPILLRGLEVTVQVFLLGAVIAYFIAFVAGLGRTSQLGIIRFLATTFVELFRGTSLLVQMFFFVYALPLIIPGLSMSAFIAGALALGLNYGAYASEVVRGAVLSISHSQTEAAISLNMSKWQRMRFVIMPQAVRLMLPGFGNNAIELLKGTSLVSIISLSDMTFRATLLRSSNTSLSAQVEIFTYLLILYFLLALPLIFLARWLEKRASKGVSTT